MGNEYDYKCKGFELKAVTRSEFEALKRFGDHQELQDGSYCGQRVTRNFAFTASTLRDVRLVS
jgi:hypothetical protein